MRHLLAATAAGLLFVSGAAFAQSTQSPVQPQGPAKPNYLGARPADGATSSGSSGVTGGSGQGGYLGTKPGADPARSHQTEPSTQPPVQSRR